MPASAWQPPRTGSPGLDQSLVELADRLVGIDSLIASLAVPGVRVAFGSVALTDESYVEWRGGAGSIVLPDAAFRGTGRGSLITVQNFGTGAVTVRAPAKNSINGAAEITIGVNSGGLFSGNGVKKWSAIKPGGGHVIRGNGVPFADRPALNFLPPLSVADNPGNGSTDVDVIFPPESLFPWLSGIYYPCAEVDASDSSLTFSVATAQDILYALPRVFKTAGTIGYMAQHFSGQGGSVKAVWHAIYRDSSGVPGTRVFDKEYTSTDIGNFTGNKHETACNISVSAGEIIWFASVQKVNNNPQQLASGCNRLRPLLGTNYNGTGGTSPVRSYQIGYALAYTYAQPPSTWSGTTKLLAGATDVPMPLIKFTPS